MPIYAKYSGITGTVGIVWPLLAPLGTAAAPSYSFAIDPNTGMFSSGADTLNFSTGGVERVQINSSGWVGVGTTPTSPLDIQANTNLTSAVYIHNSAGNAVVYLGADDQVNPPAINNGSQIELSGKWSSSFPSSFRTFGRIGAFKENATPEDQSGYLALYSRPSVGLLTERVRIDSSGNVGIGTTAPSALLNLSSDTTTTQFIDSYNSTGASANLTFRTARGTAAAPTTTQLDDELGFVGARGYASNGFSSGGRAAISFRAAEAFTPSAQGSYITFATAPTGSLARVERVRITSGGAVGINAPTPVTMLDINGDLSSVASRAGATLSTFLDTANGSIVLQRKARGTIAAPTAVQSGDLISYWVGRGYGATAWSGDRAAMVFRASENWTDAAQGSSIAFNTTAVGTTSTTEKMRIDSAGNVGIGTTNPVSSLAVQRENAITEITNTVYGVSATNLSNLICRSAGGTVASPTAILSGDRILSLLGAGYDGTAFRNQVAVIGESSENWSGTNRGSYLRFETTANASSTRTERMRIDNAGNVGVKATSFGTSAAAALGIANGTEPSSSVADQIVIGSVDLTAGNTIPYFRSEGTGMTGAGITNTTVTHKIAIKVNGTVYYLLATTNGT